MPNNSLHGLIIINKPPGVTSHGVVKKVKKVLHVRKAGHTGTLDPFATGVLTVCINEGTKLVPFLMEEEKEYEALLQLGIETDTQDITGRVLREVKPLNVTKRDIERTFQNFRGKVTQIPPMYSALKYKGVPLYFLARQGKEIERPERVVEIRELSILKTEFPRVAFRVVCSKGTYVRTLASDLGKSLGCGASLVNLKRTRSGKFLLQNSITLNLLEQKPLKEIREKWIISPTHALSSLPAVVIDEEISCKVHQGKIITRGDLQRKAKATLPLNLKGKVRVLNPQGEVVAVADMTHPVRSRHKLDLGKPAWKLLRVFNF